MTTTLRALLLGSLVMLASNPGAARARKAAQPDLQGRPWVVFWYRVTNDQEHDIADFDSEKEAQAYQNALQDKENFWNGKLYDRKKRRTAADDPVTAARDDFDQEARRLTPLEQAMERNWQAVRDFNKAESGDPKTADPKKKEELEKAKALAGQVPAFAKEAKRRAEEKLDILESRLNAQAERENAKNAAAWLKAKLLQDVQAGENARKDDVVKKIEKSQKEFTDLLNGMPPEKRKSVLEELDKAMPGFKKDIEKNSLELYRKYFDSEGKLNNDVWEKDAKGYQTYKVQALKMYGEHKTAREEVTKQVADVNDAFGRIAIAEKGLRVPVPERSPIVGTYVTFEGENKEFVWITKVNDNGTFTASV